MKKAKEASGLRKVAMLLTVLMISIISFSQSKDTIVTLTRKASTKEVVRPKIDTLTLFDDKPVAKYKTKSDTLVIADVKFIKAGDKVIEKALLEKAMVLLTENELNQLFNQLAEFSAKCANPISDWLMRFFNLEVKRKSPPNQ